MNCPRCKKDFITENISFFKWVKTTGVDAMQTAFVMHSYGRPLCNECLETLKECFYSFGTNPYLKLKLTAND